MSWLLDAIAQVRECTNEPPSKYSNARVIYYLELACCVELGDIFSQADGPNTVLWKLAAQPGTRCYRRPPHIMSIHAIFKTDDRNEREWFVAPRSRESVFGPGITFDNDMIYFAPDVRVAETYDVWHTTTGEIRLATGLLGGASSGASLVLGAPTLGQLDTRDMGYAGATCRVTATDGRVQDGHVSESSFDGATHRLTTLIPYDVPLAGATYEMVPPHGALFMAAIAYQATLSMLAPDCPMARISRIEQRLAAVRRQLRQNTCRLNLIVGKRMQGDTWLARTAPIDGWRGRRSER